MSDTRTNLLFVLVDEIRHDVLSRHRNWLSTPALDGSAAKGTSFDHAEPIRRGHCEPIRSGRS